MQPCSRQWPVRANKWNAEEVSQKSQCTVKLSINPKVRRAGFGARSTVAEPDHVPEKDKKGSWTRVSNE
eukprot:2211814-Pleurochrysis_carterae.AAC.1